MSPQTTKQSGAGISPETTILVGIALVMALGFQGGCAGYPRTSMPAVTVGSIGLLRAYEAMLEHGNANNARALEVLTGAPRLRK